MELGLNNKVAFIAGSSKGIGLEIACAFLREGAKVVITGRNSAAMKKAEALLKTEAEKSRFISIAGDMTDATHVKRALDEAISAFGGIDAVVANIGNGNVKSGWDVNLKDWQDVLNTNLLGGVALEKEAMPHLIKRGGGSFTFIASIVGCEAVNAPITYSAAKAAVLSTMKNLSRIVGSQGVRVNAVAPGNILFPGGTWESKLAERREFFEQYIKSEVPLQRFGKPEEIADAVVFLSSERAGFITGTCLVVDGGQTRSY